LISLCPFLRENHILVGSNFQESERIGMLRQLDLDYIICIHFPYIIKETVLCIPNSGVLNLHPAFLPFNRGWHTPTWAILDGTPIGATLHFMDEGVDTGDIVHQKRLNVSPGDTADTLYKRLKRLELEVFKEAWPGLISGNLSRKKQLISHGTIHKHKDLFKNSIQKIDLDQSIKAGDLIQRLRALTTNKVKEAAYFEVNGKSYRIQVAIHEEIESD
jgi:methionyl-tRNA formyltransferase